MIFLDSNIPMYLVGAEHPNKVAAQRALERSIAANERMVTSLVLLSSETDAGPCGPAGASNET